MNTQTTHLTTLPNGFRVITDQMSQVDSVAMSVWVNAGSRNETKENCGIAHFLEHMAFKGTKSRTALDIAKEFDSIGGQFNAYTSKESTVYYAKVLKEHFVQALNIIADILINSTFDQEEIEKERGVILQEIAQTDDTPDDILLDKYVETAYPQQSLGRPILGTIELVNSFGKQELQQFVKDHYHGEKMLLSVAGNINHAEVVQISEQCFGNIPKRQVLTDISAGDYQGGEFRETRDLEQVHVALGFDGLSYNHDNYYASQLLALILGGGMSSRLFQEVREKHGLAYSICAFNSSYRDTGMLNIYSGTSPDTVPKLLDVITQEIHKAANNITAEEVRRAKSQIKSSIFMSMENNSSRVDIAASSYVRYNRYVSKQEMLDKINGINTQDLQLLIQSILESKKPITFAAIGRLDKVPNYKDISNKLN